MSKKSLKQRYWCKDKSKNSVNKVITTSTMVKWHIISIFSTSAGMIGRVTQCLTHVYMIALYGKVRFQDLMHVETPCVKLPILQYARYTSEKV